MKRIKENHKITYKGKCHIIETNNEKYVIKPKTKDMEQLYSYLNLREFNSYPTIIDKSKDKYFYEYLNDLNEPINQKASDLGVLVASLHTKTSHDKKITKSDIEKIYNQLNNNIIFAEKYYEKLFYKILNEEYMKPSYYLLIRNQTKILGLFNYLKKELNKWYKDEQNKEIERVVYCHNNLSIDHFLNNKLISWDHYQIDTPILDIINLYHQDFNKYDFSSFLKTYLKHAKLLPNEKRLLFITISIPKIVYFNDNDMDNTVNVSKLIEYINETEKLIRPYYPIEQKE